MAEHFCTTQLDDIAQLVRHHRNSVLAFCVLHSVFSLVANLGNLLVIRALWKASSMPATVKKLFLSLAFSDHFVGMLPQLMLGVIYAVMLKMASTGDFNFVSFCPTILSVLYYLCSLLATASFLNVTAIAVDRLLAVSLHLRYQELVTSKHIVTALVLLWLTSAVTSFIYIFLPKGDIVVAVIIVVGLLTTTVAYILIYKAIKYHQNQIHSQLQMQNVQAMELLRQRKSAYNALFVYVVFLVCYLPYLLSQIIMYATKGLGISIFVAIRSSMFLIFLNSSLNPLVYCWRYREIREIVKCTVKKIFRMNENMTQDLTQ